jgi:hypothetical protein
VGFDPLPGLLGDPGGRDDAADLAFVGDLAVEPIATRAGFITKDEGRALGVPPAAEVSDSARSRPDGPEGDDLGVMFLGDVSDGDRLLVNIQSDVKRARRCQG